MAEPLLKLSGVSKVFGPVVALDRVDLEIGAAEAVGLIGDNGAGKSTLVKILSGLYPPTTGTVQFDGRELRFASPFDAPRLTALFFAVLAVGLHATPALAAASTVRGRRTDLQ